MRRVPKLPNFFIAGHIVARNFPSVRKCKLGFRPAPLRLPPQLPIWLFALGMIGLSRESVSVTARNRNDVAPFGSQIGCPSLHKGASLFQRIATAIGKLGLVASNVSKGSLGYFARKGRYLAAPVTE